MAIAAVDEDDDEDNDDDDDDDDETNRSHIGVVAKVVEGFDVNEVDGSLALAVVVVSISSHSSIDSGAEVVALLLD